MYRKKSKERVKYLEQLTPFIPQEILINWECSEDAWCLKNRLLQPIYMNSLYSRLLKKGEDGALCALSPFKSVIAQHDSRVTTEMRKIVATGIFPEGTDAALRIFECERMPFYDHQSNPSGIISHIKPIRMVTLRFFITGETVEGAFTTNRPPSQFSAKEWEVACLMMSGMSEREMADILCRSLRTIKFHKSNILSLTQCETTREFLSLARQKEWDIYIPPLFSRPRYIIGQ